MFSFLIPLLDVFRVVIAIVVSLVFFTFSGLILVGSAVALTIITPLFIIFSPILIPATLATAVLTTGFTACGTVGVTAVALFMRLIKHLRMGLIARVPPPHAPQRIGDRILSVSSAQTLFEMPKLLSGGYGGSFGGKTFSGKFGDKGGSGTTSGGSNPSGGFGFGFGGSPFFGSIPGWLGGTPASVGTLAGEAKRVGGAKAG